MKKPPKQDDDSFFSIVAFLKGEENKEGIARNELLIRAQQAQMNDLIQSGSQPPEIPPKAAAAVAHPKTSQCEDTLCPSHEAWPPDKNTGNAHDWPCYLFDDNKEVSIDSDGQTSFEFG